LVAGWATKYEHVGHSEKQSIALHFVQRHVLHIHCDLAPYLLGLVFTSRSGYFSMTSDPASTVNPAQLRVEASSFCQAQTPVMPYDCAGDSSGGWQRLSSSSSSVISWMITHS
jgi:hypothetical protein